jgi:hypothetical protein
MNKEEIKIIKSIVALNKIVDKLEQRISKLEKVLESHAKCIGEMRVKELSELTPDEFAKQVRFK